MEYMYKLRADQIFDENRQSHTVYGIEVWEEDNCIEAFSDIFFDRQKAIDFVILCNRLKLSAIHITDVILDILE